MSARAAPPYVPSEAPSRYAPPRGRIDPDPSKSWLRRAWPVVKAHRVGFLVAITMSLIGLVLQVEIPNLLNEAIDRSIIGHIAPLSTYVFEVLGFGLAAGATGLVARYYMFRNAYDIEYDLRAIVYEHLTSLGFSFYDRVQSGQLISRANSDVRSVNLYLTFAPMILVQCLVAVVAFVFMLSINVPLAFVAMLTMPVVYVVGLRMRRIMFPISWLIQARLADVATVVDENVNGVRIVKSFAAEDRELRELARAATRLRWTYIRDADIRARFTPAVQNMPQLGMVMVLLFGGWMVIQGHMSIGAIVAFNAYLLMMQAPFTMLGQLVMMGQRARASAKRVYEILDERSDVTTREGADDLVVTAGDLRLTGVTFAYPGTPDIDVLDGMDLHVRGGETVAVVGRTGSGKTTIARLLARFYDVTAGSVEIDGRDVRDVTLTSLRGQVGVVADEPFLFSTTIRENIAYGRPDATIDEVRAAALAADAHGFVSELPHGYDTVVGERGYTLSGGQRQRIAIARALLSDPPVLVLDDATSAIDVHVEQRIFSGLRAAREGRTTVVVAHRLSTIALAERVVLIDAGRVYAQGSHEHLLATCPLYEEVLAQAMEEGDEARGTEGGGTGARDAAPIGVT